MLKTLGGLQWYINSTMTEIYSKELTKFSMWHRATDGYIDCIWWHDNEEMWVRNFKRGVLDAFQNDLVKTDYWQVFYHVHCTLTDMDSECIYVLCISIDWSDWHLPCKTVFHQKTVPTGVFRP